MRFFRFLVISLMTSASIAFLRAPTKHQIEQLSIGCRYTRVPVLESLPRPVPYPEEPFFKDVINLISAVASSLHSLPSSAKSLLSPIPAPFPAPASGFIMVCGLHPGKILNFASRTIDPIRSSAQAPEDERKRCSANPMR